MSKDAMRGGVGGNQANQVSSPPPAPSGKWWNPASAMTTVQEERVPVCGRPLLPRDVHPSSRPSVGHRADRDKTYALTHSLSRSPSCPFAPTHTHSLSDTPKTRVAHPHTQSHNTADDADDDGDDRGWEDWLGLTRWHG